MGIAKRVSIHKLLFYTSYGMYLFFSIMASSFFYKYIKDNGSMLNMILCICIILMVVDEVKKRVFTYKEIVAVCVLGVMVILLLLSKSTLGYNSLIYILMYVFCAREISFDEIAKFSICLSLIAFAIIVLSALCGIIPNIKIDAQKGIVYYLGFRYGLYPAMIISNITMLYLYLKRKSIKIKELLVLFCVNYIIFKLTVSRLTFFIVILLLSLTLFIKIFPSLLTKRKVIYRCLVFSFLGMFLFSIYIIANYESDISWMSFINDITESRIQLQNTIISQYDLDILGRNILWSGNGLDAYGNRSTAPYMYADTMYINMSLKYGLLETVLIIAVITGALSIFYHEENYYMLIIMSLIAAHGFIDDLLQYLYYNTFWIAVGIVIKNKVYKHRVKRWLEKKD